MPPRQPCNLFLQTSVAWSSANWYSRMTAARRNTSGMKAGICPFGGSTIIEVRRLGGSSNLVDAFTSFELAFMAVITAMCGVMLARRFGVEEQAGRVEPLLATAVARDVLEGLYNRIMRGEAPVEAPARLGCGGGLHQLVSSARRSAAWGGTREAWCSGSASQARAGCAQIAITSDRRRGRELGPDLDRKYLRRELGEDRGLVDVADADDEALAAFGNALAVRQRLVARNRANTEWQNDLSISYISTGDALKQQGKLKEALESADPAIRKRANFAGSTCRTCSLGRRLRLRSRSSALIWWFRKI